MCPANWQAFALLLAAGCQETIQLRWIILQRFHGHFAQKINTVVFSSSGFGSNQILPQVNAATNLDRFPLVSGLGTPTSKNLDSTITYGTATSGIADIQQYLSFLLKRLRALCAEIFPVGECPVGWVNAHDDGCFIFLVDQIYLTWIEATLACEQVILKLVWFFSFDNPFNTKTYVCIIGMSSKAK